MIKADKQRGFSLMEVLIYIVLVGGVVTSFVIFFLAMQVVQSKNLAVYETVYNLRLPMDLIAYNVRSSVLVVTPAKSSSSTELVFEDREGVNIRFYKENNRIKYNRGTSTMFLTSDNIEITDLIFENNSAGNQRSNVSINIVGRTKDAYSGEYYFSKQYNSAISVRR